MSGWRVKRHSDEKVHFKNEPILSTIAELPPAAKVNFRARGMLCPLTGLFLF